MIWKAMFHVKHKRRSSCTGLRLTVLGMLLVASAGTHAAINKCTGADGKVVFSDQPCAAGQSGSVIQAAPPVPAPRPVASAPAGAVGTGASGNTAAMEARRQRLEAAMTPECKALRERMTGMALSETAQEKQLQAILSQFEAQCRPAMARAMEAEYARDKLERDAQQKRSECATKRSTYEDRRARLASLTPQERGMVDQLGTELARDCR